MDATGHANTGKRVVIVGGGASGLMAAIAAGQAGCQVRVIDTGRKLGHTILASGNGRCNFTNADLGSRHFNHPDFFDAVCGTSPLDDVLDIFDELGLWYKPDGEGRYYPLSRSASSVLDVILARCQQLGVQIDYPAKVSSVRPARVSSPVHNGQKRRGGWLVDVRDPLAKSDKGGKGGKGGASHDETIVADALVWAAGGGSAQTLCSELNLRQVAEHPVLCPLATDKSAVAGLDGVRVACRLTLFDSDPHNAKPGTQSQKSNRFFSDVGEVLFRPYGISGIVTFDASRIAQPGDYIELDFIDELDEYDLIHSLAARLQSWEIHEAPNRDPQTCEHFLDGVLHPALALKIMRDVCGRHGEHKIDVRQIAHLIKHYPLRVRGTADESHAQVTRGGIDIAEVNPHTMALRRYPGLFICGEAIDMDADCGGFNLSWAWLTGQIAGNSAARELGIMGSANSLEC